MPGSRGNGAFPSAQKTWGSVAGAATGADHQRAGETDWRFRQRRRFPDMLAFAAGVFAILLLAATAQDSFEVMLLPRRVLRRLRFVSLYYRLTWAVWSAVTERLAGHRRDQFLGVYGALSIVLLFGLWIAGLMLGYGLLLWVVEIGAGATPPPKLG